jgi:hypothetical protein
VPLTGGYIQANGQNYENDEFVWDTDFYTWDNGNPDDLPPTVKFIPIPSNATITSIEWRSSYAGEGDVIYYPNQIETPFAPANKFSAPDLYVTVNGNFQMVITFFYPLEQ